MWREGPEDNRTAEFGDEDQNVRSERADLTADQHLDSEITEESSKPESLSGKLLRGTLRRRFVIHLAVPALQGGRDSEGAEHQPRNAEHTEGGHGCLPGRDESVYRSGRLPIQTHSDYDALPDVPSGGRGKNDQNWQEAH